MRRRSLCTICILTACLFLLSAGVRAAAGEEPANLSVYYVQSDSRWASVKVGKLTIADSACGIAGICNAVYYLTGRQMDLVEVANKAHDKHYYNTDSVAGVYRSVFMHSAEWYGDAYGYKATEFLWGNVKSSELMKHIASGGTAVLHVPGHFMTLIDYDEQTERYLIIDSMPGDVGRYDSRRKGITHTGGDWLTAETLSDGYTKVDGYSLFTRILSGNEKEILLAAVLRGLSRH